MVHFISVSLLGFGQRKTGNKFFPDSTFWAYKLIDSHYPITFTVKKTVAEVLSEEFLLKNICALKENSLISIVLMRSFKERLHPSLFGGLSKMYHFKFLPGVFAQQCLNSSS